MHNRLQTDSIKATFIFNTKQAVNDSGTSADKNTDFCFTIMAHISAIKSIIKAATPASIPFNTAASTALEINI